jgi:isochorismate pyruvate lyase
MIECRSIEEVRSNIDRIDAQIVPLLAERSHYVEQAANFKRDRQDVLVPERIEQIILHARHLALENGADPDLLEKIYRSMIDAFVLHEAKVWRELHRDQK